MRKIRIFVLGLESAATIVRYSTHPNLEIETISEESLGFPQIARYETTRGLVEAIRRSFEQEHFDGVVICNNLGHGVQKVRLVPEALRSHTVVMWTEYAQGFEQSYVNLGLGLCHFTSHDYNKVGPLLEKLFQEEPVSAPAK